MFYFCLLILTFSMEQLKKKSSSDSGTNDEQTCEGNKKNVGLEKITSKPTGGTSLFKKICFCFE